MALVESYLFSVIVPAYNEEQFIKNCLTSLVNQDYPKDCYEIIVVNNNSKDDTQNIVRTSFPQIKIVQEKKQGLVYARQKGIAEAKGDIIAFIDADSVAQKNWLSQMAKAYLKDNRVVGVGQNIDFQPKGFFLAFYESVANKGRTVLKILPGTHFSIKKSDYLQCGGFSSRVDFCEDIYLTKKLKKVGKVIIQDKGLVSTSPRRLANPWEAFSYTAKTLISSITISLFDFSFFKLKPSRKPVRLIPQKAIQLAFKFFAK
jgi:glycosyltransferase involved in cell wall biosynthesis